MIRSISTESNDSFLTVGLSNNTSRTQSNDINETIINNHEENEIIIYRPITNINSNTFYCFIMIPLIILSTLCYILVKGSPV